MPLYGVIVVVIIAWIGGMASLGAMFTETIVYPSEGDAYYNSEVACTADTHKPCERKYIKVFRPKI